MKSFIVLFLLVISLFGVTTVYADHPDAIIVTLDKESYEYGDTVFGTAQLIEPWDSPALPISITINGINDNFEKSEFNNNTGIITFNYTLLSETLIPETYQFTSGFRTYIPYPIKDGYVTEQHHYGTPYNLILNSDLRTTTIQNLSHIQNQNTTDIIHLDLITNNTNTIRNAIAENKAHMNTMMIDDKNIISQINNTLIIQNATLFNHEERVTSNQEIISQHHTIIDNNTNNIITIQSQIQEIIVTTPVLSESITNGIELTVDNVPYYQGDTINVIGYKTSLGHFNGVMQYTVHYGNTLLHQGTTTINSSPNFEFDVMSDWDFEGEYSITVNIEEYSSTTFIYYYNITKENPILIWNAIMTNVNGVSDVNYILTNQQAEIGLIKSDVSCIKAQMNGELCTSKASEEIQSLNATIITLTIIEPIPELSLESVFELALDNQDTIANLYDIIESQNVIIAEQRSEIDAFLEGLNYMGLRMSDLHPEN